MNLNSKFEVKNAASKPYRLKPEIATLIARGKTRNLFFQKNI